MSAAFTPGPWTHHEPRTSSRRVFMPNDTTEISGPNGGLVAALYKDNWPHGQDEANARLIAAAPELYEALEVIASCGAVDVSNTAIVVGNEANVVLQQAWAALRKARGDQ